MKNLHPTAIVDPSANLGKDVTVGPFSIIESDVVIGEGTRIHSHALIAEGSRIGSNCEIHHGAAIGTKPQDLKFSGEKTLLEIGDNTIIREFCDLNRGTKHSGTTKIGSNCLFMAYCHTGHDCMVGDNVILANGVQLGGHVVLEDWVIIGGMTPVHQFCKVGQHAMLGGGFRAVQDVPPFILAAGEPLKYNGVNAIGLGRRGFSKEAVHSLRHFYRILYRSKMNTSQALQEIRNQLEMTDEIKSALQFIESSDRGIIR